MPNQLTGELIALIFSTSQILREKVRGSVKAAQCSFPHFQVLHYIEGREETAMKDIAGYLHITPPSATSLVNHLVDRGLLARVPSQLDRRSISLRLTAAGAKLMQEKQKRAVSLVEKAIDRLTPAEKKSFIKILRKISQPISK